ncbi:hypothetical protein [Sediminibacter sp. Hel_I_10]|uniref:hypothetical protein n=1 Tax=Sediminibacter sp. Hel_I_10 TaxID=1392490 RepID=UPI0012DD0794|nr:hypothetical protein [Sediminibacter sp. Hel_I_10]
MCGCAEPPHYPGGCRDCSSPGYYADIPYYYCQEYNPNEVDWPGDSGGTGGVSMPDLADLPSVAVAIRPEECLQRIPGDLDGNCQRDAYEVCMLDGHGHDVCACVADGGNLYDCSIENCLGYMPQNNLSSAQIQSIYDFLDDNDCSDEAKAFTELALEALPDGEVDYVLEIIFEITETIEFQNQTCLKSIKDEVVSTGEMKKIAKKFQPTHPVLDLEWGMFTNTNWGNTGNTGLNANQDGAFINLNTESLSHVNNIVMVQTIAHELIHAELYRKLKELVDDYNLISLSEYNALQDNFMGIADYTLRYGNVIFEETAGQIIAWGLDPDLSLAHHNQMAAFYRQSIIDAMKAYDLSEGIIRLNAEEFYEALSWAGLRITSDENGENSQYTDVWRNFKDQIDIEEADIPESDRTYSRYLDIISQEYNGSGINCN